MQIDERDFRVDTWRKSIAGALPDITVTQISTGRRAFALKVERPDSFIRLAMEALASGKEAVDD